MQMQGNELNFEKNKLPTSNVVFCILGNLHFVVLLFCCKMKEVI